MSAPRVSAPFTAQLRARPGEIRLGAEDAPERWTVRVQVADAWDAVRVSAPPAETVLALKVRALEALRPDAAFHDDYVVKLAGVVVDEHASLADVGAADGSIFLVMLRRRQPVR
jgi:hypothetical protein